MTVEEREGIPQPGTSPAPCTTGGPDFRSTAKHHYGIALKRFAKFFPAFLLLWVQLFVFQIDYLLPIGIVGFLGSGWTLTLLVSRTRSIRKCSRVLRTYPLQFRTPVEKLGRPAGNGHLLRLGDQGDSPLTLRVTDTIGRPGWTTNITNGVWFAGDEPFGGAIIVPGSGELLCSRSNGWAARAKDRDSAGPERIEKARRAGAHRPMFK
ncbi:hypothetical protein ACIRJS_45430 [Streptomyces sp. NPDC102340]|uniref:hypothetical protein n=1 Tax=unclassified Streptomyces TaxID=2593676 RepID=UPI003808DE50